jgi:adenine deaminase
VRSAEIEGPLSRRFDFACCASDAQRERLVKYGRTPMQAIRAATFDAARVLGHETEFGSIAHGKSAHLVAVAGDPLTDIRTLEHVKAVIVRGENICGADGPKCRDASPP